MKCLFLGSLPVDTEWIVIPLLLIFCFVIFKAICNLFK
jgi:hypothetical protein